MGKAHLLVAIFDSLKVKLVLTLLPGRDFHPLLLFFAFMAAMKFQLLPCHLQLNRVVGFVCFHAAFAIKYLE